MTERYVSHTEPGALISNRIAPWSPEEAEVWARALRRVGKTRMTYALFAARMKELGMMDLPPDLE